MVISMKLQSFQYLQMAELVLTLLLDKTVVCSLSCLSTLPSFTTHHEVRGKSLSSHIFSSCINISRINISRICKLLEHEAARPRGIQTLLVGPGKCYWNEKICVIVILAYVT